MEMWCFLTKLATIFNTTTTPTLTQWEGEGEGEEEEEPSNVIFFDRDKLLCRLPAG
jgi:hypothetical protein